jgi:hypothetical protein
MDGGDGMEKRTCRLVKPQLLVPLKPRLGRGKEFEIVDRRTLELPQELVELMWRKQEFVFIHARTLAEFIESEAGRGCDAAVLTDLEFCETGGKRGARATVDLIRFRPPTRRVR